MVRAHVDNIVFSIKHFNPFGCCARDYAIWEHRSNLNRRTNTHKLSDEVIHFTLNSFFSARITTALIFYRAHKRVDT